MTGQCCSAPRLGHLGRSGLGRPLCAFRKISGFASRGRRISRVTGCILPAVILVFLPKCPLCLAPWLTLATGIGFSAAVTAWVPASIALLSFAGFASVIWSRAFRASASCSSN